MIVGPFSENGRFHRHCPRLRKFLHLRVQISSPWIRPLPSFKLQLIVFFMNIEPELITGVDRAARELLRI